MTEVHEEPESAAERGAKTASRAFVSQHKQPRRCFVGRGDRARPTLICSRSIDSRGSFDRMQRAERTKRFSVRSLASGRTLIIAFARPVLTVSALASWGCGSAAATPPPATPCVSSASVAATEFVSCLRRARLESAAAIAQQQLTTSPARLRVVADLLEANAATSVEKQLVAACEEAAVEEDGERGPDDVDPPKRLESADFQTGDLLVSVRGSASAASKQVWDTLASKTIVATPSPAEAGSMIVAHNVHLEDQGPIHRVVSLRFQIQGGDAARECTELRIAWRVQTRGKRDRAWQVSSDADAPPLVVDIVQILRRQACP
jgi:hypothetical protein